MKVSQIPKTFTRVKLVLIESSNIQGFTNVENMKPIVI